MYHAQNQNLRIIYRVPSLKCKNKTHTFTWPSTPAVVIYVPLPSTATAETLPRWQSSFTRGVVKFGDLFIIMCGIWLIYMEIKRDHCDALTQKIYSGCKWTKKTVEFELISCKHTRSRILKNTLPYHIVTAPFWWPRAMQALWQFWHIVAQGPSFEGNSATKEPVDTSWYFR